MNKHVFGVSINRFSRTATCTILGLFVLTAFASSRSPYVGQQSRDIKSLAPKTVAAYLNGKGLGYAKAAELNHYPGPSHVIKLADELNLTDQQLQQTQVIFNRMKDEASVLGKQFVTKERELDRVFANGLIKPAALKARLSEISALEASIRYVHLNAHLEQKRLLTKSQCYLYDQLRGYGDFEEQGGVGSRGNHSH